MVETVVSGWACVLSVAAYFREAKRWQLIKENNKQRMEHTKTGGPYATL